MISREAIDEFFADNKRRGESLDGDMLWGYFFTHHDGAALEDMQPVLEALGYTYVGILEPEDAADDDDDVDLLLHVERVETHSPASLFKRCRELSKLAEEHGLDGFDGFDVGHVDGEDVDD